ncbi:hypothetical protein LO771_05680 [Streptacidiphilus sp. ASG 303]|uniref:hypothetical protein n=1 Tax=Streptacidiphilus sp. ASG 303 TaxID=2896847 RepID=UPI001E63C484|nr:hypothetical protein [Streptacidiphilus sp. ASG 303]MCD0481917.1 hypothetical protein [Streptacidiphilus sp. ASG 303]
MIRPTAVVAAFALYLAGVFAVATTDWSAPAPPAAAAPPPTAAARPAPGGTAAPPAPSRRPAADPWSRTALRDRLVAELDAADPGRALADLERATRSHPVTARYCHPIAHELGHAALVRYRGDFAAAARFRDDVCGSGYLHGIVEETLADSPHPATDVTTLCAPEQSASCIHGIGHGAMFVTRLDVAGAERLCSRFTAAYAVTACAEGVFMQLFEPDESDPRATANLPARALAAEPLYPCPEQPAAFRGACYFYAPVYFLQRHDYAHHPESYAAGLAWCRGAPVGDGGREACTRGMGSRIMKYNIDRERWAADRCEEAPAGQRGPCVAGMVSYYRVHHHSRQAADRLCALLSGEARRLCRDAAGTGSSAAD